MRRVREGDKIILATTAGKAIMFSEEQVRATGRDTSGVRGIGMKDGVSVLVMEVTNGNGDLFVITERGYGKRTPVADYPEQNRGGQGVYTIQMTERKGNLAAMKTIGPAARAVHRDGGRDSHSRQDRRSARLAAPPRASR